MAQSPLTLILHPHVTVTTTDRIYLRFLPYVIGLALILCLCKYSPFFFISDFPRSYNGSKKARAEEVELANFLVRQMYGQVEYEDKRLAVVNYSIVPGSRSCHGLHYFVIVHTRADDRLTREKWRSTYGQLQHQFNFNIIFVTGLPQRESLNNELRTEAATHGDILQGHFIDSYRNLTMKNVAALRYVAAVCPTVQAVVKLDDDVAWNIQNTKRIVDDAIRDQRIYCPLSPRYPVPRDQRHPWHVSMKEYSETHYPPHCSGLAYAMPRSAYFSILGAVNKERYFWIDDIFVTGLLANRSRVKHTNIWGHVSLYTKLINDQMWHSDSTFTLIQKEEIEHFFVITNAQWLLKNYWSNGNGV